MEDLEPTFLGVAIGQEDEVSFGDEASRGVNLDGVRLV